MPNDLTGAVLIAPREDFCRRAIARMRSPNQMHIICVDITNKCDLACSNCTRLLENQDAFWDMSIDNFRLAVRSLHDYPGIIAVIGGNPVMHRHFEKICEVFCEEIPDKRHRGLWTNNVFKYADLAKQVFGVFNLNPHGVERGIKSMAGLKEGAWYHEGHSMHSPLLVAGKDIFGEEEMWERIARCDVNQNWSATVTQNKGELRAYFCEVAGAFDLARGTDHGVPVVPGWWRRNIAEFEPQVRHFCPGCGVPARLQGHMDHEETDTYSESNEDLALKSLRKKRKIVAMSKADAKAFLGHRVTDYSTKLQKETAGQPSPVAAGGGARPTRRNEPCPCGSGKRFKHCHGASV